MSQLNLDQIVLEITCADCTELLNKMSNMHISGKNIHYKGNLELSITVSGRDYLRITKLVKKLGGTVDVEHRVGIQNWAGNIKERPIGLFIMICLLLITIWVPQRIFFISVNGNISVPANRIIEAVESCGLRFGALRQSVRSEAIKNALLQEIPQLQWVGVNTIGCTATISVREKTENELNEVTDNQVCSIVASRDGIIQDCTVYQGNPLCTPGQAVRAGQVLVSGYTDCGLTIKATRAEAEITALTFREIEVLTPEATAVRDQEEVEKDRYYLRLGKKIINLSKDSGNLDAGCVKIYTERFASLPGGFALPLSLVRVTTVSFEETEQLPIASTDVQWLESYTLTYLNSTMIAGSVVSSQTELIQNRGINCLQGRFACIEMIGQVKLEQMQLKD